MEDLNIVGIVIIGLNIIMSYYGFKNPSFFKKYLFSPDAIIHKKEYIRIVSSGFLHVDWMHLLFNMMSLYFFHEAILSIFGVVGFLIIYFASLIGGNLLSLLVNKNNKHYTAVGASGAVSGIIFAFIAIVPNAGLRLMLLPIDFPAWVYGIAFVGISMFGMAKQRDNIGHDAHLGGAIIGMLIAIVLIPAALTSNLYIILGIMIPAIIFLLILIQKKQLKFTELFKGNQRDFGYTVDDKYNLERKNEVEELDALLELVSQKGYDSLSKKEKERLTELSQKK